jgi:DnaA family protein
MQRGSRASFIDAREQSTRTMQQLSLDLLPPPGPTLDNFVAGPNREALDRLSAIARGDRTLRILYLWGEGGSGKTHLLSAINGRTLGPACVTAEFTRTTGPHEIVSVDDCDRLGEAQQEGLFHLFNRVLARPGMALVCAGAEPPLALRLRDDLRTRLGYGLVLRLRLLSDEHRREALEQWLDRSGARCSPDLIEHLLRHRARDLRSLLTLLRGLDRYGLERQRALTLPLLREFENPATDKLAG